MKQVLLALIVVVAGGLSHAVWSANATTDPAAVPRMTTDQLKAQLGNPDLIIIDVRTAHDWNDSSTKIKGAIREKSYKLGTWIEKYPEDKAIVLYCK
jgi:hypothetical protein